MITFNEFVQLKENNEVLAAAREWLKELSFSDVDPDELEEMIDSLTDMQVIKKVNQEYDGGWQAFCQTNQI